MHLNEIRKLFLDYFAKNGHEILPSSPLVPANDPTLLFTNAGMVQFKNYFTGVEQAKFKKVATSQKCLRAGGKHNDLDNVGYTARHHTFFEMLGNFSFADYFKEEAIKYAYEFVTKELALPKDKLLVTIYHDDEEAYNWWKKIANFSDDKIIRISSSDNFWSMGETGPCGPCSEIFYDHGSAIKGEKPGQGDEGDRFIEIWNLVFMQYETLADGSRIKLPKPAIDTGMGLERVSAILQGKHNNFEIDLFANLIKQVKAIIGQNSSENSARVIADHLRSAAFLIADGVLPSNEGRGYVLRRIIRRAMRHSYKQNFKQPILTKLLPALLAEMGDHYQELQEAEALLDTSLLHEEEKFGQTLSKGLDILNDEIANSSNKTLSGEIAFKLYDTYGFPADLTADILRDKNMSFQQEEFAQLMHEQKQRGKENWRGSGENKDDKIWFELRQKFSQTKFHGYELEQSESEILAIIKDQHEVACVNKGDVVLLVFADTVFYAESGGQVADTGVIKKKDEIVGKVLDVKNYADGLFVHKILIEADEVKVGDKLTLLIDKEKRQKVKANHSATHLLHAALRQVLGSHVIQKGSLVTEKNLRFDFAHNKALSKEEIKEIEKIINAQIRTNQKVETRNMQVAEAKESGALMLFGEKYADEVRVLTMGVKDQSFFSKELCGGTHVTRLADIALFVIMSESSIASGVRRIEALTAESAYNYLRQKSDIITELSLDLKVTDTEIVSHVAKLQEQKRALNKELELLKLNEVYQDLLNYCEEKADYNLLVKNLIGVAPNNLREISNKLINKKVDFLVLISENNGKLSIIAALSNKMIQKGFNAAAIVKDLVAKFGGKGGGGKANFAQGGAAAHENIAQILLDFKANFV